MKKILRIIQSFVLLFCITVMFLLPVFIQAQNDPIQSEMDMNMINDQKERTIYFFKKGILVDTTDVHYFRLVMREGKKYIARLWITAPDGGDISISLTGDTTFSIELISVFENLKNEKLEFEYLSDATIAGEIRITYVNFASEQKPTYTLYANRAGFAGLWWIILSGISVLAILVVLFTFAIIGMISVAKKRPKKRK
ncbi:MAG: hypothetical protein ACTSQN_03795 [Candidatus Heimdallarchaeota archaeon]